ncbi:MAG: hypothetical protein AAGF47_03460 [Planctomycetota bacterium]
MTLRPARFVLAASAVLVCALAGGCYSYLGVPRSKDAFTYQSTPLMPATVSLIDARTDEVLWSVDVPVNQKLVVRFYDGRRAEDGSDALPAMMRWEIGDRNEAIGSLVNEVAVPRSASRRLSYEIREGAEFADNELFPAEGAPPPVIAPQQEPGSFDNDDTPAPTSDGSPPELEPIIVEDGG